MIMPRPRQTPAGSSTATTIGLLCILLICFFPGIFHYLLTLPFSILSSPPTQQHSVTTVPGSSTTMWVQKQFSLPPRSRGSYLITDHVLKELPEIRNYKVGLLNLFVQHTSCALTLNENWDEDVRRDMSDALDRIVPEAGPKGEALYRHDAEGSDDMPAHVKTALIGASVTIPIKDGKLVSAVV
jgi:secondary thiamine-phosphate synthase enzyme